MSLQLDEHVACFNLDHKTAHTGPGWRARHCPGLDIVLNESSLRCNLKSYFGYYQYSRTHLSLDKDAPDPRAIQPSELGALVEIPEAGGLHHRYERRAA